MKQKISVILARTNWDGEITARKEHKIIEIEVDNPESELCDEAKWHVVGEIEQRGGAE